MHQQHLQLQGWFLRGERRLWLVPSSCLFALSFAVIPFQFNTRLKSHRQPFMEKHEKCSLTKMVDNFSHGKFFNISVGKGQLGDTCLPGNACDNYNAVCVNGICLCHEYFYPKDGECGEHLEIFPEVLDSVFCVLLLFIRAKALLYKWFATNRKSLLPSTGKGQ